jgi:hypothetical protein
MPYKAAEFFLNNCGTDTNHGHGIRIMGRTVLPFSQVLEQEAQEWRKFRRGLRKEDQQFLDRIFEAARLHVQAGVYASRPWPFETILISILIEHEKALVELRAKLKAIEGK